MNKIKIYTGMDEVNKIHYSREFEIVDELPVVGDEYGYGCQYKVIAVNEVKKDCEQGNPEAWKYECYEVVAEDQTEKGDEECYDYRYMAIKRI